MVKKKSNCGLNADSSPMFKRQTTNSSPPPKLNQSTEQQQDRMKVEKLQTRQQPKRIDSQPSLDPLANPPSLSTNEPRPTQPQPSCLFGYAFHNNNPIKVALHGTPFNPEPTQFNRRMQHRAESGKLARVDKKETTCSE